MNEKSIRVLPGMIMLLVTLALGAGMLYGFIRGAATDDGGLAIMALGCMVAFILMLSGFFVVEPNGSKVLLLFGKYVGTVKKDGFHWTNPFQSKRNMSLRVRTFNGEKLKVNDASGNPIEIAIVVVWRVVDTYAASFDVDMYDSYVHLQSETALRHSAGSYPYDASDDQVSLRQNADEVSQHIKDELQSKLKIAGVEVLEARIAHLAYASEIAGAMLRRQQAAAVIAARQLIVDGAVGMVEQALERMDREKMINLDEERKAAMVSNLMVVLCSDHQATPVVNTGSLY
ncbi:MAG: SPFH domain-containing protein [Fimbriimonadaceae bacterium]|nr:MAG: SPFH domain-containing protein [Fimbriimonadaceae bacterium]